jgi:hypothetical protein
LLPAKSIIVIGIRIHRNTPFSEIPLFPSYCAFPAWVPAQ